LGDESRHVLSDLYINEYTVWIQKVEAFKIHALFEELDKHVVSKQDVGFNLTEIEKVFIATETSSSSSDDCSDSEESGSEEEEEEEELDSDDEPNPS